MFTVGELLARLRFDDSEMEEGEERARGRFAGLGDHLKTAGLAAGAIGGAMLAKGLSDAMDMETATAKLTASLGATGEEAAAIGRASGAVYASGWGESLDDVNEALGSVVSSFSGVEEMSEAGMQQATKSAMALARTFDIDVSEAATAAGAMVKQGLVDDSVEAFNTLTAAAQTLPKSMVGDLPAIVTEYGVHLKRIGLDAQTSFGLMSQYVNAGGKDIDQAADVLHEFGRITSEETDRAAAGFKGLGLDSKQMLTDLGKGGPEAKAALQATLDALRGVEDPAKRAQLQVALFGDMAGESVDALLAMDPASATAGTALDNTSGAAQRLADQVGGTTAQSLESLKRQFSQGLATAVSQALPYLQKATDWITEHSDLVKQVAIPVLIALGLGALVMGAQVAAGWIMAMGPVGWAAMAIGAAVALIIMYWDEIKGAAAAVWNAISSAWGAVAGWFSGLPGMFAGWFSSAGSWLLDAGSKIVSGLLGGIAGAWSAVIGFFGGIFGAVLGFFVSAGQWLLDAGSKIIGGLLGGIKTAFLLVVGFYATVYGTILGYFLNAAQWLLDAGSKIIGGLLSGIKTAFLLVLNFYGAIYGTILGYFLSAASWLLNAGRNIISGLLGGIQGAWGTANGWLSQIGSFIGGHFANAASWLFSAGKKVVQGLIDGLESMIGAVGRTMGKITSKIGGFLPGSPVKWGPLYGDGEPWRRGARIAAGIAAGIDREAGAIDAAMTSAVTSGLQVPTLGASLAGAPVRGSDGGAMPVFAPQITFAGPVYSDRSGMERLTTEMLPLLQEKWRSYDRSNI
ncbi:hypothetical protein MXD62_16760 [Frankia sp. Mgl5]|uniref:phage tail tape measure protein n=1 Tax=Frankia sp. Mgl5 TaxID=2933793 RepID=UPI00201069CE|nr:phage tail tape measure protein [Frankia sp. Mgl5]MCK9928808.1 hypothetical protein [Frankia sp. Mgl5]